MLSKPSSICWRSIFNSSLVLGFVGAGGIGFELLTAMNLFQYRTVSLLPLVTFRVSGFGGGILLLIQDYYPTEEGNIGQIIAFTHDPDEISYVAPDFQTFLHHSLSSIKEDPEEFLEIFRY